MAKSLYYIQARRGGIGSCLADMKGPFVAVSVAVCVAVCVAVRVAVCVAVFPCTQAHGKAAFSGQGLQCVAVCCGVLKYVEV